MNSYTHAGSCILHCKMYDHNNEDDSLFICSYVYVYNWTTGLMSRVFTNGLGDRGSIPGRVIPKTQKNGI